MSRFLTFFFLFAALAANVQAFAPSQSAVAGRIHLAKTMVMLRMAEGGEPAESPVAADAATEEKAVISADGTFYDDEIEPVAKSGISDSMRERLRREASTGLDPDQKQTNVLLYIMAGVAVLVLLGGGGILY